MKRYLFISNTAHGFKDSFAVASASGFVPDGGIEIGEGFEAEDFFFSDDGVIVSKEVNVIAREKTSEFFHEVMRNIVHYYRRSGVQPVIIRDGVDGPLKIIMMPVGTKDSRALMLAPNGFEPGDEKYLKDLGHGVEIDFAAKERDLKAAFNSPKKVEERFNWNQMSLWQRFKKSFWR